MTDQAAQSGYHEIVQAAYAPCVVRIGSEPSLMHDDYTALIRARRVLVVEKAGIVQGQIVLIPQDDAMPIDIVIVSPEAQGI